MLSNEERREAYECLRTFLEMESKWPELGIARQKRIAASSTFVPALAIMQATDRQSFIDIQRRVAELKETGLSPQPLIDGNDLIRLGLPPGESFGPILDAVYDAQLEGSADTREQAESLALTLARSLQEGRGGSKMGGTHN